MRELYTEIGKLHKELASKGLSLPALSGALLHIAKQGISIKHGRNINKAPNGDLLEGIHLKSIIWHGRNHSMHYEDKKPTKGICMLFRKIGQQDCNKWNPEDGRNYADRFIDFLGWYDYSQYEKHMLSLN